GHRAAVVAGAGGAVADGPREPAADRSEPAGGPALRHASGGDAGAGEHPLGRAQAVRGRAGPHSVRPLDRRPALTLRASGSPLAYGGWQVSSPGPAIAWYLLSHVVGRGSLA